MPTRALGRRLEGLRAALPEPSPPVPPLDPTRLTKAQIVRMAELQTRWQAVGIEGLTDAELDEVIAVQKILTAPGSGEG